MNKNPGGFIRDFFCLYTIDSLIDCLVNFVGNTIR